MRAIIAFFVLTSFATAGDEIELFDGKTLDGWKTSSEAWSVKDGVLTTKGKPAGVIRTKKDYENYVLTFEWRWPKDSQGGNSGLLVHTTTPKEIGPWPKSIEVQLHRGNAGDFWVIGNALNVENEKERKKGRRFLNLTDDSEKPFGEWNKMEVTCKGDTISVKVNGDLVNKATNCSSTKGAICFQAEGTPLQFRNIKLKKLSK